MCVCGGGGGGEERDLPPLLDLFFCYAFERMNTSKMTQIERTGRGVCVGNVFSIFYVS